ncbi:unnamed protein product [Caenorhabditis auriculariae]|uniref:Uncharacterized protein n=1 Tax=Caenorhabditis auriculariae TaxID=2777116 RepID=A0A8S1H3S9_9PELO|nr:unnamed protein product [Caenorhabditis auriculariae]
MTTVRTIREIAVLVIAATRALGFELFRMTIFGILDQSKYWIQNFRTAVLAVFFFMSLNIPFFFYASTIFCLFDMITAIQRLVLIFGNSKYSFLVTGKCLKNYITVVWMTLPLFYVFKYGACPDYFCDHDFSCEGNRKAYIFYHIYEISVYFINLFTLIAYIIIYRHITGLTQISLEKKHFEKFILLQAMPMTVIRTIYEITVYMITLFTLIAYITIYRYITNLAQLSTGKRNYEKFILLQAMPMTMIRTIREVVVLYISLARAFNMPKKFSTENPKVTAARDRKATAKKDEVDRKQKAAEDAYWADDDKLANKKIQRKEEEERKKLEAQKRREELKKLADDEMNSLSKNPQKVVQPKVTRATIDKKSAS